MIHQNLGNSKAKQQLVSMLSFVTVARHLTKSTNNCKQTNNHPVFVFVSGQIVVLLVDLIATDWLARCRVFVPFLV